MLNFILAPIGVLLIGGGAWGLYLALRKGRKTPPQTPAGEGGDAI